MELTGIGTTLAAATERSSALPSVDRFKAQAGEDPAKERELRQLVGDYVGNVFYGTLLQQMRDSTIKGKYFHGGRGEEVFQAQLHMELATRMGRAPGDPIANRMYEAMTRGENRQVEDRKQITSKDSEPPREGVE